MLYRMFLFIQAQWMAFGFQWWRWEFQFSQRWFLPARRRAYFLSKSFGLSDLPIYRLAPCMHFALSMVELAIIFRDRQEDFFQRRMQVADSWSVAKFPKRLVRLSDLKRRPRAKNGNNRPFNCHT